MIFFDDTALFFALVSVKLFLSCVFSMYADDTWHCWFLSAFSSDSVFVSLWPPQTLHMFRTEPNIIRLCARQLNLNFNTYSSLSLSESSSQFPTHSILNGVGTAKNLFNHTKRCTWRNTQPNSNYSSNTCLLQLSQNCFEFRAPFLR